MPEKPEKLKNKNKNKKIKNNYILQNSFSTNIIKETYEEIYMKLTNRFQ